MSAQPVVEIGSTFSQEAPVRLIAPIEELPSLRSKRVQLIAATVVIAVIAISACIPWGFGKP